MSISMEFAKRVVSTRYDTLPPEAIHWAKVGLLDTLGVSIAGSRDECVQIVSTVSTGSSGKSLLWGQDRHVSAMDAAQINGTAAHALDFDDCSNTMGGHPSAPILPALFALADEYGARGQDLLAAYVVGFETECKLSMCVNFYQYTKGWHPTATLGIFGATAACANLLQLNESKTALALGIATSMAAGIKANLGTMTKPLHVGNCARNAVFACLLARDGFTSSIKSFEHKMGYFNVFNGEGNYDTEKLFSQWANPWDIVKPGIAIKQYTCCGSTHPAVDATLDLAFEHNLNASQVAKIETWTHPRRLEHTNRADPQSDIDARFSVQYVVCRALLNRKIINDFFENNAYKEPSVQSLLKKVTSRTYTTEQFPADNHFAAEVRIELTDGRVVSKKLNQPYGRTSENPLSAQQLKAKFDGCISGIIHPENQTRLYEAIQGFEKLDSLLPFTALISAQPVVL
ncbi:MAG: MmgE/PrpD family protein [Betaproteobacteria bacterium]